MGNILVGFRHLGWRGRWLGGSPAQFCPFAYLSFYWQALWELYRMTEFRQLIPKNLQIFWFVESLPQTQFKKNYLSKMAPTSALCTLSLLKRAAFVNKVLRVCNVNLSRLKIHFSDVPVKNGSDPPAVRTVALQLGGQLNAVLQGNGAVGEGGDEELVPAWPMGGDAGESWQWWQTENLAQCKQQFFLDHLWCQSTAYLDLFIWFIFFSIAIVKWKWHQSQAL